MTQRLSQIRSSARYYLNNKERIDAHRKEYYATHSEETKAYSKKRSAMLKKRGDVCDMLTSHASDLADDSERMSTSFILKQIELLCAKNETNS